jgi:hypothetical protein
MANVVILTAGELVALDVEGRGAARRAARETATMTRVLQLFLDRGGPIAVGEIVANLQRDAGPSLHEELAELDEADLIRISGDLVDIAYPFSARATTFLVRLQDGRERHVCCAIDALGIAPMVGQAVEIRTRCQHSGALLQFAATPDGPGPDASSVMLWVGKRPDERCRGIDGL